MGYKISTAYKAKWNGGTRTTSKIKYIVLHYTANSGTSVTAKGNAKYFSTTTTKASAHYIVDEDETIYQTLKDTVVAYAVGGSKWATSGGSLYGKAKNANTINIEMVSHSLNGVFYIPEATINHAVELVKDLMAKYNITADCVIRHWDVNGKPCPLPMCQSTAGEIKWKEFKNKLTAPATTTTASSSEFKVKVNASALNIRSGAGTSYAVVGTITNKGTYTITETSGNWGKLKSGAGWINISSSYCSRV